MTNKNQIKMDDLKAIEKCPELTDYIVKNRVKDVRKTAIIVTLVAIVASFGLGLVAGLNIASTTAARNVVEVKVNANDQVNADAAVVQADESSK